MHPFNGILKNTNPSVETDDTIKEKNGKKSDLNLMTESLNKTGFSKLYTSPSIDTEEICTIEQDDVYLKEY